MIFSHVLVFVLFLTNDNMTEYSNMKRNESWMKKTNTNGWAVKADRDGEEWRKEWKSMHGSIVTSKKCAASLNNGKFAKLE